MTTLQQPQATESHNTDVALSLQNVTISYGNFEADKNVYCASPSGKVTAAATMISCQPQKLTFDNKSLAIRVLSRRCVE